MGHSLENDALEAVRKIFHMLTRPLGLHAFITNSRQSRFTLSKMQIGQLTASAVLVEHDTE